MCSCVIKKSLQQLPCILNSVTWCHTQLESQIFPHHYDVTQEIWWTHPLRVLQSQRMFFFCIPLDRSLQHLSDMEKMWKTEPLSIASLAHINITLKTCPNGTLNYYVNEVSQAPAFRLMEHLMGQRTNTEGCCVKHQKQINQIVLTPLQHVSLHPSSSYPSRPSLNYHSRAC